MSEKIKLTTILEEIDFDYVINENNTFSLVDLQHANLGNIENEEFKIDDKFASNVINRINTYILDNYINGYINTLLEECNEEVDKFDFEDILKKMKKHPKVFNGCIEAMKAFINPKLFDISDIIENSKMIKKCFRCGTRLMKSTLPNYAYFCHNCYEDFYNFEV